MPYAGSVPDEGDYITEFEGTCCVDGQWIDPTLFETCRLEEMEYTKRHGVFEVIDEIECSYSRCAPLSLKWFTKMKGNVCR